MYRYYCTWKKILNLYVLQCKGGKLEEAEDFKLVFAVYCALKSK